MHKLAVYVICLNCQQCYSKPDLSWRGNLATQRQPWKPLNSLLIKLPLAVQIRCLHILDSSDGEDGPSERQLGWGKYPRRPSAVLTPLCTQVNGLRANRLGKVPVQTAVIMMRNSDSIASVDRFS